MYINMCVSNTKTLIETLIRVSHYALEETLISLI